MSANSLEDGEIASEAEPTPERSPSDLNDEFLIDQFVQDEQASSTNRSHSPEHRRNNRAERRRSRKNDIFPLPPPPPPPPPPPFERQTSWHINGQRRAAPSESVIFGGMPNQNSNPQIRPFDVYPPGINRIPLQYFPAPPAHDPRPLMSIPFNMYQPPPPFASTFQPISPSPLPATFDDNYEQVSMDMVSPDEPQRIASNSPVEIPLEAVKQQDDEAALRNMLLLQLNEKKKKRNAEQKQKSPIKRARKASPSSKLSNSVEKLFDSQKRIVPPAPAPRIEVKISQKPAEDPSPGLDAAPSTPDSPESPPPTPAQIPTEVLTREARKARLQLKLFEITKRFEEEREKVENASREAKTAAQMAKKAAEMAKQAEEMNRQAVEMREKCIEDSRIGKIQMRAILIEKNEIQGEMDLMSIDDLDDVDVEEFPEIIISSVKRSVQKEEPKREEEDSFEELETAKEPDSPRESIPNEEPMEEEEEVEGEDEYEEVEDEVVELVNEPPPKPKETALEQVLRQRLMNKMTRAEKSPENVPPVVSSSSQPEEHVVECRNILYNMCKFELNGKCERPRDCFFLHLRDINDHSQQTQVLECLFRDVFHYKEADIERAIEQTLHFLPDFQQFEKLMEQFFKVVIHQTPDYKNQLFTFFATMRR